MYNMTLHLNSTVFDNNNNKILVLEGENPFFAPRFSKCGPVLKLGWATL